MTYVTATNTKVLVKKYRRPLSRISLLTTCEPPSADQVLEAALKDAKGFAKKYGDDNPEIKSLTWHTTVC